MKKLYKELIKKQATIIRKNSKLIKNPKRMYRFDKFNPIKGIYAHPSPVEMRHHSEYNVKFMHIESTLHGMTDGKLAHLYRSEIRIEVNEQKCRNMNIPVQIHAGNFYNTKQRYAEFIKQTKR